MALYCDSPEVGGAEIVLGHLLAGLGEGFEPALVGTSRSVIERIAARRPGVPAVVLPHVHRKRDLRAIAAHFRAFRRLRPDVVHLHLSYSWASHWAVLAALATPGARTIAAEMLPSPPARRRQVILKRLTSRRLAAHVAVGERSADELAALTGLPRESFRVLYNGVPDVALEPLPRPVEGRIVGSLGRLERQKGFDVLVRALAELEGVTAVVVGDGAEREALLRLARELGVGERLLMPGRSEEARRWLTAFDVFTVPSRAEGLPLVIVEAMLAGLPVVASDVGSIPEAVVDGETGLLVPPEDPAALAAALRRLLESPDAARAMGERGRARARERFTVEAMVASYEALYREVTR